MENSRHTPDYIVYTITETGAEQKNFWQRVGAAFGPPRFLLAPPGAACA